MNHSLNASGLANLNSPSKRNLYGGLGGNGGNSPSPAKNQKTNNDRHNEGNYNWLEFIRKEQEKIIKKPPQKQQENQQSHNQQDDDDQTAEGLERKHPYIQVSIDKEYFTKKYLVKSAQLSPNHLKDFARKEKNLITDLPQSQGLILHNGVECHLKKVFGQYQNPIKKSIHFISSQSVLFFAGNYLALHNVIRDETKYIGIDANLSLITCFEVQQPQEQSQPAQLQQISQKSDRLSQSPGKSTQGYYNDTNNLQSNSSPQQQDYMQKLSIDMLKSPKSQLQSQMMQMNHQQIIQPSQSHKEMQTIVAYAEKAKETYIKEQKFQSKKVYGIQNSKTKKNPMSNTMTKSPSPSNHLRSTANGFDIPGSPTKMSIVDQPPTTSNFYNQDDFTLQLQYMQQNLRYLVRVNVFSLANPSKKYVLQHFFDEYFYVQQIQIRDKESLCYTLCTNANYEQLFFIWNFRKEIVIGHVEMKNKINKFMVTPSKPEMILFLGECYLKYYEANFTNKIIKENSMNIIPMKIEKESNFIDVEYINPRQGVSSSNFSGSMFVIITSNTNSIFVYENNQLKHKLFDEFKTPQPIKVSVQPMVDDEFGNAANSVTPLNKTHESILSDSLEIGELSDREDVANRGEEHLRVKSIGTNSKKTAVANNHSLNAGSFNKNNNENLMNQFQKKMHQIGSNTSTNRNTQKDNETNKNGAGAQGQTDNNNNTNVEIVFQKLIVTQKGFIIGASNGYIICYEFKNDYEPKMINKIHISNKFKAIASMSISKGNLTNDDYMIAVAGVYQKEVKQSMKRLQESTQESRIQKNITRRNSITIKLEPVKQSVPQTQTNFFMPPVIQSDSLKKHRMSMGQTQHHFDARKRQSTYSSQQPNNRAYQDGHDQTSNGFFGPGEFEERLEFVIVSMKAIQTQQQTKIVEKIFSKGAHDSSIYQISQCRNKSSFYTISEGNCLKVWNHTNEWKGATNFVFDEQPLCIDVHPSSWQIALGFKSGVKIYQSPGKEMKLSFEKLGKAALSVGYSDGGHLLACSNAVYIDIIDPVRMQVLITLFGHKGLVKSVNWTLNSKYLITTCSNGGLYFWKGNFKEQAQKINNMSNADGENSSNPQGNLIPIGQLNDKNYLYTSIAYDDELDTIIALTSTSTLRMLINNGTEPIYEEDLLTLQSLQGDNFYSQNLKATCMTFSKTLSVLIIGFSNGKISIIQWPIIPFIKTFKYDIFLQSNAITDVKISYSSRYVMVSTDDGNFYVLETFRIADGIERSWVYDNQEKLNLQKKRETYGLSGFSVTDNIVLCNKSVLANVNRKIDKLKMMKKSQEVNHEIKKRKTEKRYEKQMKLIEKELDEELQKQEKLKSANDQQFHKEKAKLTDILEEQTKEHYEEKKTLVEGKEKNLNFVSNENDELETRILRLKETIIAELEHIEEEHQMAVEELVTTYEQSVKLAQDEVKNTIEKIKQNGNYYENMIKLQEKDYENEVSKLQADLIEEHADFINKKEKLEQDDDKLKNDYQNLEQLYKEKNTQRKQQMTQVQDYATDFKFMQTNLERLGEKNIQSNIFIDEKEKSALHTIIDKKQLENVIVFLSEKIKELKNERMPLEQRKKELENMIQDTYRELQEDFQFRKYLDIKQQNIDKQMEVIGKEIRAKEELKEAIEQKNYVFKRELSYLADAQSLKGWTHKMQGMLKCMSEVYFAAHASQVKKISMAFIHIAEIMESNSRPYRPSQDEEDNFTKQSKLNEMELAYYRNKNSQKMEEMQFRYKALFSQMEKSVKKLRNDNIKLIEEFNTLINEKKKLNNLRKMIKESIKEYLGDKYDEEKHGSSEDDGFKVGAKKKKKRSFISESQERNAQQLASMKETTSQMMRSKSSSLFADKHAKILQTARDRVLPDLKQNQMTSQVSQVALGSMTERGGQSNDAYLKKNAMTGFSLSKNQQMMQRRRIINNLVASASQSQPLSSSQMSVNYESAGSKYLEKIVGEFEKNKKQIEEQTKALQRIQNLAQVFSNSNQTPQYESEKASSTVVQQQQPPATKAAVPNLNLKKIAISKDLSMSSGLAPKQTITTRVPNTTERTASVISMIQQNYGQLPSNASSSRQLPTVQEKSSLYATRESGGLQKHQ